MAVKFVPKRYSPEEIEALKKNPNVLEVRENRLLLTIEFRQQVYEAWIRRPERSTVRRMLEANGFDTQRLGLNFTKSVESVFKRGGRPKFSKASPETQANWAKTIYMPTMTAEELVESGKFVWDVNRLILHPDFEAELYRNYPQQSIEDGLLSAGISPADMGYHKIYWLQEKFEHSSGQDTNRSATRGRTAYYTAATVEQYRKHPYVQTATREKIELNKAFFEAAAPIAVLAFDDILRVFDIDPEIFSVTERYRMSRVLAAWATPADGETINASPTRKILRNRMRALDSIVEKGFLQIGDIVSSLNVLQKKSLCLWLRDLPPDPGRKYSVRKILSLMKISRASYYAILKNGTYGQGKSYLLKLILTILRESGMKVICLDPEHEYIDLTNNLGGCFVDLMSGEYIINVLEPKTWDENGSPEDMDAPMAFQCSSKLSQHISFLKDFFRTYKNFTDSQIDTIEIMLGKLYEKWNIRDDTDFSKLSPTDYPILSDLYDLMEEEYKNYDAKKKELYTAELLQEICLGLHSMCKGAESKFFNGHTNITDSSFLTFGVKGLLQASRNVKDAMLFNILSYMSNELLTNGHTAASIDEFYLFLTNLTAVEYIRNFMKRVRKKDSAVILASQNLEDFNIDGIREYTKPLFSIPTHAFLFNAGNIDAKFYIDTLQLEKSEYNLIRYPQRGVCLYKCGNERYNLMVHAPEYKEKLFGSAGGR